MYRFLATPKWIGFALLTLAMAAVMVWLGNWQLDRYHQRSANNDRVDAASRAAPAPLDSAMPAPAEGAAPGTAAAAPARSRQWAKVTATGRYDAQHEILVRSRTVDGNVGFEIVTPLVLPDGSAVLVDRGWTAPAEGGATATPQIPPAPTGEVTVVGRVHLPESRAEAPATRDGKLTVRRIAPQRLATALPYPVYGGYLTMEQQTPPADSKLVAVPPDHENAWQNAGYVIQWWMFAAVTVLYFGYLVRKHAHERRDTDRALDDLIRGGERLPPAPTSPGG